MCPATFLPAHSWEPFIIAVLMESDLKDPQLMQLAGSQLADSHLAGSHLAGSQLAGSQALAFAGHQL